MNRGMSTSMDPAAIMNRVMRLARLDTTVFEEVRDDQSETLPAIIVAAVCTLIAGLGGFLWLIIDDAGFDFPAGAGIDGGDAFIKAFLLGSIFAIVLWLVWVAVTFFVLVQIFREPADIQSLFRTMGYGAIPLAGTILMFIPAISLGIALIFMVMFFVMQVYAVQAATGTTADRALLATGAGFAVYAIVLALLADAAALAPGIFTHAADITELV
jgi:hypothetical protein